MRAFSISRERVIAVSGRQSDVAEEALGRSKPQDNILISFADRTLAIIDPLKSSGLSPGKRPGSFGVPERRGETVAYRLIGRESLIGMHPQFVEIACHVERVCSVS